MKGIFRVETQEGDPAVFIVDPSVVCIEDIKKLEEQEYVIVFRLRRNYWGQDICAP